MPASPPILAASARRCSSSSTSSCHDIYVALSVDTAGAYASAAFDGHACLLAVGIRSYAPAVGAEREGVHVKPFNELLVVEIAGSIAGAYAGKLFSDHGARVVKIEPPGGDSMRTVGMLAADGVSTLFHSLNTGKQSIELDITSEPGQADLRELCQVADVVIESSSPGPLVPLGDALTGGPGRVRLRISPFGLDGPYAGWHSTPFTDFAVSGHMYLTGEPDREPLQGAGPQALYASGTYGFIGAMTSLLARDRLRSGQDVDVSHFETMTSLHQWTTVRYTHGGVVQRRAGNRYGSLHPSTIYECNDGFVAFGAVGNESLGRFLAVVGMGDLLDDPRFESGAKRFDNADEFDAILGAWMREHSVAEVVRIAQEVRAPVAPVQTISGILADEHLNARNFWRTPPAETWRYPGPPFRMSGRAWRLAASPGLGDTTVAEAVGSTRSWDPGDNVSAPLERPLEGLRVLDLTRVWAGPLCTRILGDLGADIIKVEAPWARGPKQVSARDVVLSGRYPDNEGGKHPWNREGMFNKLNRSKRSLTLDLRQREGIELLERLVSVCDVVIENYTPRVMPQLGLSYERLRQLNPSVISIGMPGRPVSRNPSWLPLRSRYTAVTRSGLRRPRHNPRARGRPFEPHGLRGFRPLQVGSRLGRPCCCPSCSVRHPHRPERSWRRPRASRPGN